MLAPLRALSQELDQGGQPPTNRRPPRLWCLLTLVGAMALSGCGFLLPAKTVVEPSAPACGAPQRPYTPPEAPTGPAEPAPPQGQHAPETGSPGPSAWDMEGGRQ